MGFATNHAGNSAANGKRVALVTGASRGIGAATAVELARAGVHVILLARTQGGLEETDDAIRAVGGSATLMPMDLRRLEKIDALGPAILEQFGRLDILVGNAGMLGELKPAHQITPKDSQIVMDVNFMANQRLVHTLDPLLRASDAGRVVFTTAGKYAVDGLAYWAAYMASKAALNVFMKTYAAETRRTHMRVNAIYPGAVETALLAKAFPGGVKFPTKTPADIAPKIAALCMPECTQHGEVVEN